MAKMGRPRSFDREAAVRQAMLLFWSEGYEGVTLGDLQAAIGGISPPSFYAAFGSKETLFREAVALYLTEVGAPAVAALEAGPTAREGVVAMLDVLVGNFCGEATPRGCLLTLGALQCAPANRSVQESLGDIRREGTRMLTARLIRGQLEGDIAADANIDALAVFYTAIAQGLGLQAKDGAGRKAIDTSVRGAMAAWDALAVAPPAP
jgi:AcrR family transcriptional regulator